MPSLEGKEGSAYSQSSVMQITRGYAWEVTGYRGESGWLGAREGKVPAEHKKTGRTGVATE